MSILKLFQLSEFEAIPQGFLKPLRTTLFLVSINDTVDQFSELFSEQASGYCCTAPSATIEFETQQLVRCSEIKFLS